jgi:hypothetical protein
METFQEPDAIRLSEQLDFSQHQSVLKISDISRCFWPLPDSLPQASKFVGSPSSPDSPDNYSPTVHLFFATLSNFFFVFACFLLSLKEIRKKSERLYNLKANGMLHSHKQFFYFFFFLSFSFFFLCNLPIERETEKSYNEKFFNTTHNLFEAKKNYFFFLRLIPSRYK